MFQRPTTRIAAFGCLALMVAAGCLKRKETITIASDGSTTIRLHYTGTPSDFKTADALPAAASGWPIEVAVTTDGKDETQTRVAQRTFAAGQPLPRTFAAEDDPDADLYLDFPTTVRTERRADGVYYHYRRTYQPRKWAYVRYWQEHFINEDIDKLGRKPAEELTLDERIRLFKAFAASISHEKMEMARAALAQCDPDLPADHWLMARRALLDVYAGLDYAALVRNSDGLSEEERNAHFDRLGREIEDRALSGLVACLRATAGYDDVAVGRFETEYERAKRQFDITNQLGGHGFEIRVKMPGEILAHNADRVDADDAGAVVWEFDGKAFRDRPYELSVTSRVANVDTDG